MHKEILYDGALGGTPDTQGKLRYHASPEARAGQQYAEGATILDTMEVVADAAGYMLDPRLGLVFDRAVGCELRCTFQLLEEDHALSDKDGDGVGDRAGFSVILLSADRRGVELGFWRDQAWAQEQGAAEPPQGTLFTHAEGAPADTSAGLVAYTLAIQGDAYTLSVGARSLLSGPLRDYTAFEGSVNPYRTPNFIFLGDDSGSARARVRLAYVELRLA